MDYSRRIQNNWKRLYQVREKVQLYWAEDLRLTKSPLKEIFPQMVSFQWRRRDGIADFIEEFKEMEGAKNNICYYNI
ncbi:MAG: hypothetical protein D6785_07930 [Planctomycetota bacterium]|nr:MAG: hypothetical protein D6785_07930 [Planctomycetota bacterium]